jgi:transcriptional regulator
MQVKPRFDTILVCLLYHQGKSPQYIAKHLRTTEALIEAILQQRYKGVTP